MLIFWKQRLVFLAVPKTGSTAIETALAPHAHVAVQRPPDLKHTPMRRYRTFVAPWLEAAGGGPFTAVALMREPVSWLGSWYRYRARTSIPDPRRSTAGMSFEAFVEGYLARPRPGFASVGSQAGFLAADDGPPAGLELFRYERMDRFLAAMEDRIGQPIALPRLNESPPGELVLSPQAEDRLRQRQAADFALYQGLAD